MYSKQENYFSRALRNALNYSIEFLNKFFFLIICCFCVFFCFCQKNSRNWKMLIKYNQNQIVCTGYEQKNSHELLYITLWHTVCGIPLWISIVDILSRISHLPSQLSPHFLREEINYLHVLMINYTQFIHSCSKILSITSTLWKPYK